MRIETPAGGYIEIKRDDFNVFEESPSAIVLKLGSDWTEEVQVDFGPTLVLANGYHAETLLSFPMQAARQLHEALGRLIDEAPLRAENGHPEASA